MRHILILAALLAASAARAEIYICTTEDGRQVKTNAPCGMPPGWVDPVEQAKRTAAIRAEEEQARRAAEKAARARMNQPIFRCSGIDGSVGYSETPCRRGSMAVIAGGGVILGNMRQELVPRSTACYDIAVQKLGASGRQLDRLNEALRLLCN